MDVRKIFRRLVTNQRIPKLDYHTYELAFHTVYKVSSFSYQWCPCAFEHEFVTYISNEGTINEALYDHILQCIMQGKCPHVNKCTEDAVTESKVFAIHIAAAANTTHVFKKVSYKESAVLKSSICEQTPFSIALMKENLSVLTRPVQNVCCFVKSSEKPYTIKFKLMDFSELCVIKRNRQLLKRFYKANGRFLCPSVNVLARVLQYGFTDMRQVVLGGDAWNHTIYDVAHADAATIIKWCELAFLYDDRIILTGILDNYGTRKEDTCIQPTMQLYYKHHITKKLKELSSVLKRESCVSILSKHCSGVCPEMTSSSIVLTLLKAIMRSHDFRIHNEITIALKLTNNISELVNIAGVHSLVLEDLKNGKTDVLRTILYLGANVNLGAEGKTLLDKILGNFMEALTKRIAIEMLLYENPDVHVHATSAIIAVRQDFHVPFPLRQKRIIKNTELCMDAKEHGRFGHDGDTLALNFLGHLLVECGFIFRSKSCEILRETYEELPPFNIPNVDIPRSLQLICRDSLRRHYKGRQIHAFVEGGHVPSRIKDFILLKPTLKAIKQFP